MALRATGTNGQRSRYPATFIWREGRNVHDHVYKLVEVTGSSTKGIDDAVRTAIARASTTIRHLEWFEVIETRGHIKDGAVAHF